MRKLSANICTKNPLCFRNIFLKYFLSAIIFLTSSSGAVFATGSLQVYSDSTDILGRWDITVSMDGKDLPSWLEIKHSGYNMLVGRFVSVSGSARPVSRIHFKDGVMSFAIPPQWDVQPNDLQVQGKFVNGAFEGTMIFPDGKTHTWKGTRAPVLRHAENVIWGNPVTLFDGKNMSQWHTAGPNQWVVESGILKSPHSGSNLVSNDKFNDFKLHIEVRYPSGSNSGIYLRGRYEVQVEDSYGREPSDILFGAVYGFLPPNEMTAKPAGEWQIFDITLIGRRVTVVINGKTVICEQEIPGITGGALDSHEAEPGPIYLQGDHGPVEYRNIIITPAT